MQSWFGPSAGSDWHSVILRAISAGVILIRVLHLWINIRKRIACISNSFGLWLHVPSFVSRPSTGGVLGKLAKSILTHQIWAKFWSHSNQGLILHEVLLIRLFCSSQVGLVSQDVVSTQSASSETATCGWNKLEAASLFTCSSESCSYLFPVGTSFCFFHSWTSSHFLCKSCAEASVCSTGSKLLSAALCQLVIRVSFV